MACTKEDYIRRNKAFVKRAEIEDKGTVGAVAGLTARDYFEGPLLGPSAIERLTQTLASSDKSV